MDEEEERPPERPAEVTAANLGEAFFVGCRPLFLAGAGLFVAGFIVWAAVNTILHYSSEDRRQRGWVAVEGPSTTDRPSDSDSAADDISERGPSTTGEKR